MKTVAILDKDNRYIGKEVVSDEVASGRIVVHPEIDLPANGTYKWMSSGENGGAFLPLGQGFPKQVRSPVAPDYVYFLALKALLNNSPMPEEVKRYVEWYDSSQRVREEEATQVKRITSKTLGRRVP